MLQKRNENVFFCTFKYKSAKKVQLEFDFRKPGIVLSKRKLKFNKKSYKSWITSEHSVV